MLANVVLLLLYLGHQSQTSAFWLITAKWAAVLAVLFPVIFFLGMLTRTLFASRELISLSDKTQTVLGKPLLFPVKFKHIRFSPAKDRFNNRFLVVGVPVGLRCRIGNLLAIDDKSLDVTPPPGVVGFSWTRLFSHWSCWFSFDSARFLHRGDHGVDLREKLDNFLISQNEDPSQWPYAYLLGIPQFMGWSRSVVSWWYLYNEERELDALILEINNSYWEKRNVFLRIKPTSDKPNPHYQSSETAEYLDQRNLVRSLPTATKVKFYGGEWHKYIFASPFEKVDGVVSQRMMDPLSPCAWASDATFSNMTTLEETGEVRMATRLTCDGPPIDPTQMSCLDVAKLVLKWTMPVMLTTPEIFWKAIKIRFTGLMKMNSKPPVRSGSVGRHITRLEINLEPIFRAYLAHCVETYPEPVELRYLPCRSFTNDIICMRSPSFNGTENASVRCLTVEPADPAFYTRIISYPDVRTALAQETGHTGHDADPTAQPLIVSDITLLSSILEQKSLSAKEAPGGSTFPSRKLQLLFFLARPKSGPSFMDNFALSSLEPSSRAVYLSSSLKLSIANALAFGSESLLAVYLFVAFCLTRWLALEVFSLGREYILSLTALNYPAWAIVASTIVEYCLVLGCLSAIQKWVIR